MFSATEKSGVTKLACHETNGNMEEEDGYGGFGGGFGARMDCPTVRKRKKGRKKRKEKPTREEDY